jgi:hypothetical protein
LDAPAVAGDLVTHPGTGGGRSAIDALEALAVFSREEAQREPGEEGYVRQAAFGHVARTLGFLRFGAADAEAAQRAWLENHERRLPLLKGEGVLGGAFTPEQIAILNEGPGLSELVHFRIETFYFFAQRLLDELVVAMDVFFGPAAVTLGRHRTLKKNLPGRGLVPPPELLSLIDEVTQRVKDFRDDHVAHLLRPADARKARGTLWSPGEPPRIAVGWINPGPHEVPAQSEHVADLLHLLEKYVAAVLAFLTASRPS